MDLTRLSRMFFFLEWSSSNPPAHMDEDNSRSTIIAVDIKLGGPAAVSYHKGSSSQVLLR